jgi:hypothetical protein
MITGTNNFSSFDITQINQITDNFFDAVDTRGESSGFARWGGTISFDTTPSSPWHFNHTTSPSGSVSDLYSVAIHELAHALGFGGSIEWQALVSASSFFGSNANAEYGGPVPLASGLSHWAEGTDSIVYGGSTPQETAMDPTLTTGTRKLFTKLDAAAMKDIGWTVIAPPGVDGDYNNNGIVDAADYVIWRKIIGTTTGYNTWRTNFGNTFGSGSGGVVGVGAVPEATSAVLAIAGLLGAQFARGRRRG